MNKDDSNLKYEAPIHVDLLKHFFLATNCVIQLGKQRDTKYQLLNTLSTDQNKTSSYKRKS